MIRTLIRVPTTTYARSGDVNVAYQVVGEGPRDLVYVPGWISNIEVMWEDPYMAAFLNGLASFSRLIIFDKRGTGMSDPVPLDQIPGLEARMDDVRAVMDAVGSERATLLGHSEGGNMCSLFAATYPHRTDGLILVSSYARREPSPEYPWAPDPAEREAAIERMERHFGDPAHLPEWMAPSRAEDPTFREWVARYFRLGSSPRAAAHLLRMNTKIDTTRVLPTIRVPTLCLYRVDDHDVKIEEGRWIASQIPGARLVELPGGDHFLNAPDLGRIVEEVAEFVTGSRRLPDANRSLVTVLFTDIVASTERVADLGDRAWAELLDRHRALAATQVAWHRGKIVDTAGDGVLATFDGPGRAVKAALALVDATRALGLDIRAGLHTGEVEFGGDEISGMAVHIGARVAGLAGPGEVLVSRTVKDLVAGSGLAFDDRGSHRLKGIDDEWQIYAAS